MTPILGLAGRKRSGKDTVATYLQRDSSQRITCIAFADPLRQAAKTWFDFTDEQVGTEFGRSCHPDVWIRYALRKATRVRSGTVIITDVRFANEAEAIREAGGLIIGVERPGHRTGVLDQHASELEVDGLVEGAEVRITNDGTLEDLRVSVREAIRMLHLDYA